MQRCGAASKASQGMGNEPKTAMGIKGEQQKSESMKREAPGKNRPPQMSYRQLDRKELLAWSLATKDPPRVHSHPLT